jgi:DeoR/GlpR family transcriptional regulator of sugar metabolism
MLTSQRRKLILDRVHRNGQVSVQELSKEWGISEDAIRRDLREMSQQGLLQRVHGGAISASPAASNYKTREDLSVESKKRLAIIAAQMIKPGQVIGVDGGTTNLQLIRQIPSALEATVVTHSPLIAAELQDHRNIDVIILGGKLFKHSMVCLGAETTREIERFHLDIFFLGATGVHPVAGVTTGDWDDATVKRAFCSRAAEVVLMASPEKLNAASPFKIISVSQIGTLIVDETTESLTRESFQREGVNVLS